MSDDTGDDDLTARMLMAIMLDSDQPAEVKPKVSIDEQTAYLMRYIDTVGVADRLSIGNILVINNKRNNLCTCAEGTVINLDSLPENVINQMYDLLLYKKMKKEKI